MLELLLENHTLHSGTYLYGPYMAVPPPSGPKAMLPFCNPSFNFPGISSFHSIVLLVVIVQLAAVIGVCSHVYPRHTKKKRKNCNMQICHF